MPFTSPNGTPRYPTRDEIRHDEAELADAILHGTPLLTPAAEGLHSIELANAILLSSWLGRTIALPMDAAHYERELQHRIDTSTFQKKVLDPTKCTVSQDDFAKSFR